MEKQEFIKQIAGYVKKYAAGYGIKVHSPIIAQAYLKAVGEKANWPPCTIIILD